MEPATFEHRDPPIETPRSVLSPSDIALLPPVTEPRVVQAHGRALRPGKSTGTFEVVLGGDVDGEILQEPQGQGIGDVFEAQGV